MSTIANHTSPLPATVVKPPPLVAGDRMSRAEFERRYSAMSDVRQAELIEGIVYMPSPVRAKQHGNPQLDLGYLFRHYAKHTPGTVGSSTPTVRLDQDNEPQPDLLLYIEPERGGNCRLPAEGYLEGAPELVAEISASSTSYDLHDKKNVYRRNGVQEYIVWRTEEKGIDWFALHEGQYVSLTPERGILKSAVFPGLWLDPEALLRGDLDAAVGTLESGLKSTEHAAFVQKLAAKQ